MRDEELTPDSPRRCGWTRAAVPAALFVVAALFWALRIIAPAHEVMFGASDDPYTQVYPMMHREWMWIRQGILPLWNPYQFTGHPFLATVLYGVFYPPNVLFLVLPTEYAMEASAVLHLFLGGLFTYAYLREIRLGVLASFAGALTFPLSGFFASQAVWFVPAWSAAVWLPLALLAIERLLRSRSLAAASLLAICVAMPILAGWMQTWVYTMYCTGTYLAFRSMPRLLDERTRSRAVAAALIGGGAIAVGLALAAVQLLPSFELQSLGPRRPGGLSLLQSLGMGPVPPARILQGIVDPSPGFPRVNYAGQLFLLLSPIALVSARRHVHAWFFAAWAAFAVLVSLTVYTPVFTLYRLLPASTWFRFPDRILFLYAFSAAVLLAVAIDALARTTPRSRRALLLAALTGATALAWVALARPPRLAIVYIAAGLLLVWSVALITDRRWRVACLAGCVLVQLADLSYATRNPALHPYHDLRGYDAEGQVFHYIQSIQGYSRTYIHYPWTHDQGLMPKQGTLRGIYTVGDYEPLSLQRVGRFYRALELQPHPEMPFIGLVNLDPSPAALHLLNLLSVRFIVIGKLGFEYRKALEQNKWVLALSPRGGTTALYVNPRALPRAYVVRRPVQARSEDEAFAMISASDFDPQQAVVLEGDAPAEASTGADGAGAAEFPGATIESYSPNRVVVRVDANEPGWLVLTDTWYPGWQAEIDGAPAPIERANYLFRAVRVSGRSRVTFVFRPLSFRAGAAISALATLIILAGAIADARRVGAPSDVRGQQAIPSS